MTNISFELVGCKKFQSGPARRIEFTTYFVVFWLNCVKFKVITNFLKTSGKIKLLLLTAGNHASLSNRIVESMHRHGKR